MDKKKITFTEGPDRDHVYPHVTGYGYVEKNGDITITEGPDRDHIYPHIIARGQIDNDSYEDSGDGGGGGAAAVIMGIVAILIFVFAIPKTWEVLINYAGQSWENLMECIPLIIVAIVSGIVAYKLGFKAGLVASAVLNMIIQLILGNLFQHSDAPFYDILYNGFVLFLGPLMFAGMGVLPSAVGVCIKWIVKNSADNRMVHPHNNGQKR